jgi:hypothetical protein
MNTLHQLRTIVVYAFAAWSSVEVGLELGRSGFGPWRALPILVVSGIVIGTSAAFESGLWKDA